MSRRLTLAFAVLLIAGPAMAQGHVEVSGFAGYALSDGVDSGGPGILAGDGNIYNRVDPKDSFIFGFGAGYVVGEHAEVGFLYSRQPSTLVLGDTNDRDVGDLNVTTYHGYFAYNFGEGPIRPFAFGGLGATHFGEVDVTVLGVPRNIPGQTQFSTTWGGGVKVFPAPHVGVRLAGRWTPTYVKTDEAGWWCDPFWGCYLVGNPQYSNQLEFSGGVTVRF